MDPNESSLCSACHMTEDTFYFIFTCDLFKSDRDILQSTVSCDPMFLAQPQDVIRPIRSSYKAIRCIYPTGPMLLIEKYT